MHIVLKQYFLCKNITKIQAAAAVPLPQFQLPTGSDKKITETIMERKFNVKIQTNRTNKIPTSKFEGNTNLLFSELHLYINKSPWGPTKYTCK